MLSGVIVVQDAHLTGKVFFMYRVNPGAAIADHQGSVRLADAPPLRLQPRQRTEGSAVPHRRHMRGHQRLRRLVLAITGQTSGDGADLVLFPPAAGGGIFLPALHPSAIKPDDQQHRIMRRTLGPNPSFTGL